MHQRVAFDTDLMHRDMTVKGWQASDLAARTTPPVAVSTVTRFLNGEVQTARMAKRLARALRQPLERYVAAEQVEAR